MTTRGPRGGRGPGRKRGRGRGSKTTIVRESVFEYFENSHMLIDTIVGVGKLQTWTRSIRSALAAAQRASYHHTPTTR